jgi:hypothetical protein
VSQKELSWEATEAAAATSGWGCVGGSFTAVAVADILDDGPSRHRVTSC